MVSQSNWTGTNPSLFGHCAQNGAAYFVCVPDWSHLLTRQDRTLAQQLLSTTTCSNQFQYNWLTIHMDLIYFIINTA